MSKRNFFIVQNLNEIKHFHKNIFLFCCAINCFSAENRKNGKELCSFTKIKTVQMGSTQKNPISHCKIILFQRFIMCKSCVRKKFIHLTVFRFDSHVGIQSFVNLCASTKEL